MSRRACEGCSPAPSPAFSTNPHNPYATPTGLLNVLGSQLGGSRFGVTKHQHIRVAFDAAHRILEGLSLLGRGRSFLDRDHLSSESGEGSVEGRGGTRRRLQKHVRHDTVLPMKDFIFDYIQNIASALLRHQLLHARRHGEDFFDILLSEVFHRDNVLPLPRRVIVLGITGQSHNGRSFVSFSFVLEGRLYEFVGSVFECFGCKCFLISFSTSMECTEATSERRSRIIPSLSTPTGYTTF